jgi:hypothetical protein
MMPFISSPLKAASAQAGGKYSLTILGYATKKYPFAFTDAAIVAGNFCQALGHEYP